MNKQLDELENQNLLLSDVHIILFIQTLTEHHRRRNLDHYKRQKSNYEYDFHLF